MNNKDYLSQEEIDALLKRNSEDEAEEAAASESVPAAHRVEDVLTPMEEDAIGEIANITFGSAATALSTLLGRKVDITTPKVSIIPKNELQREFPIPHVAVHVNYIEGFQGINLLVIKTNDAKLIADLMLGGDGSELPEELNEIHISAVQEAMNQMMGSSATSMSTIFNRFVNISPPGIDIFDLTQEASESSIPQVEVFVQISFRLTIGDLIDSNIMQLLPIAFAKEMISTLMGNADAEMASTLTEAEEMTKNSALSGDETLSAASSLQNAPSGAQPAPYQQPAPERQQPAAAYQQPPMPQQQAAYQQQMNQAPPNGFNQVVPNRNVQPVQFSNLIPNAFPAGDQSNLNLLLDIPLKVTVELGRTQRLIKDILEFSQGSIIELDKLAGEPVDILVNNKLIAKGEVVVIDENFGVRVTDIVSQLDRIQKMQ